MDFCTVVIGVFVGIQVANWNGARVEGARAQAYFAHIPDNLKPTCNRSSVTKFSGDRSALSKGSWPHLTIGIGPRSFNSKVAPGAFASSGVMVNNMPGI